MKSIGKLMCAVWRSFLRSRLAAELPAGANSLKSASPQTEPAEPRAQESMRKTPPPSREAVYSEYQALAQLAHRA